MVRRPRLRLPNRFPANDGLAESFGLPWIYVCQDCQLVLGFRILPDGGIELTEVEDRIDVVRLNPKGTLIGILGFAIEVEVGVRHAKIIISVAVAGFDFDGLLGVLGLFLRGLLRLQFVVVDLNWMKMNAKLPGVLKRKTYGT